MPIAIRHRNDRFPRLDPITNLAVRRERRPEVMAALQQQSLEEMTVRFHDGHRAYVAWRNDQPAAWGWAATRTASVEELSSSVTIPRGQRYLWDFVTLPAFGEMGIYPLLMDAIVRSELSEADRFWVAYRHENHASREGIRKAGFVDIADVSLDNHGIPSVKELVHGGAVVVSNFLGIRVAEKELAHCWRCVRAAMVQPASCDAGPCACDYERPAAACDVTRTAA